MKLGLVTDSLADRSLAEAAAVCRGLGLEQVELGCGNWSPAPHVDLKKLTADAGARRQLLDTLGENGLTISALNCSGNPLFPGEKGARDRAVAEGTFLLAEQLGVETVVMMSGLPGGSPAQMRGSLDQLRQLPFAGPVYPGHGGATTLAEERRWNPYLKGEVRL